MKYCFRIIILFISLAASSQNVYKLRRELDDAAKKELHKYSDSVFYFKPGIVYNISDKHLLPYKKIQETESVKPGYLEKQLKLLEKNPKDAYIYNNIAGYYQGKGDAEKAKEYFTKAFENLKLVPKAKDSASYYSFRGLIKLNLGQDGTADIEKALAINKSDSLGVFFYPLFLVNQGKIAEARKISVDVLQSKASGYKIISYIMLAMTDFYEIAAKINMPGEKQLLMTTDMGKLVSMEEYDKYIDAKDPEMYQIKQMAGMFNGMLKFGLTFESNNAFSLSASDIAYLDAKEKYFLGLLNKKDINAYGVYMALGLSKYVKKQYAQAISYYEKALAAFPKGKENYQFHTGEVYDNMASIYFFENKYPQAEQILKKKLQLTTLTADDRKNTLINLARLQMQIGNFTEAELNALASQELGDSFEANAFLAYLNYVRGYEVAANRYLSKAQIQIDNEERLCNFITFLMVSKIKDNVPDEAFTIYNDNKANFTGIDCAGCKSMLGKYLVLNK